MTTPVQSALLRFRYAAAPNDPFTDASGGFVYPKIVGTPDFTGNPKYYPREVARVDHDRYPGIMGEHDNPGLKFVTEGIGFGGSPMGAGSGVQAKDGENGLLFKSAFGNQTKDTGSLVATGTSASVVKVADTTNLSVGGFVGLVDPATGLYHVRQIRSKTGTDLVLCRDLPFVPAEGAVVYASAFYTHAIEGHPYLWLDLEGYHSDPTKNWRRQLRGALLDFGMKTDGVLKFEWAAKGLYLHRADGTTQGAPTYPTNLPAFAAFVSRLTRMMIDAGEQKISAFGYDHGNDVQEKPSTSAVNGIGGLYVKGAKRAFSFTARHDEGGSALVTKLEAGTKIDALFELTQGGPGNSFVLAAPQVELVTYKKTSVNGLEAYEFQAQSVESNVTGVAQLTLGVL